jgi:hypothetical protein
VAARFKGKRTLLDISIRGEHVASRERGKTKGNKRDDERERKKDSEAKRVSRGNGFS